MTYKSIFHIIYNLSHIHNHDIQFHVKLNKNNIYLQHSFFIKQNLMLLNECPKLDNPINQYLDIIFLIYVCYNWNFKCKKICYLLAITFYTYVKSNALLINVKYDFVYLTSTISTSIIEKIHP